MGSISILVVLSIVIIIFLFIIRKKGKKIEITHFISTLLATLIGVLLAVTLSDHANIKKEKEDTVKLLKSADRVIDMTYEYTLGLESYILELEKDSINNSDSIIRDIKNKNQLPYPDLMETIISNELISKNISAFSYLQINSAIINLKKVREWGRINTYKRFLNELDILLELEIDYQNGDLDEEAMSEQFIEKSNMLSKKYSDSNTINIETEVNE
ncbi:MAG: hypothetical protein DRI84_05350 [Bacteroidetes bacterium]|nr:MAG: hypothetical protein DRI84_05350 [Bacteroidota bacterium]